MDVTPGDATIVRFFGYEGGPFTAQSDTTWTISDSDNLGFDFAVSEDRLWLQVAPATGTIAVDASEVVTTTLDTDVVSRLAPGTYTGTVAFSNTTNGQGDTSREVHLEIAEPTLSVSPTVVQAEMFEGGNLPAPVTVTLTGLGHVDLDYRLEFTMGGIRDSWAFLDRERGTVPGGGTDSFVIHFLGFNLDAGAGSMTEGAQLKITNMTNGNGTVSIPVTLTVVAAGSGAVTLTPDADLSLSGPERRMVTALQEAQLYNESSDFVLWAAEADADWITVSPASGWLEKTDGTTGGADTQSLRFRINASVNDLAAGSYTGTATIMNQTRDVAIATRTFHVNVDPVLAVTSHSLAGSVEVSPDANLLADAFAESRRYPFGQAVTLTASVNDGYAFAGWDGDVVDQPADTGTGGGIDIVQVGGDDTPTVDTGPVLDNPLVVTMDRSRSITALLVPLNRELVLSFTGSGTGTVQQAPMGDEVDNTLVSHYANGTSVKLTADADAGSAFVRWTGNIPANLLEYENPLVVTMDRDRTIAAVFEPRLVLGIEVDGEGTVSIEPDLQAYGAGTEVTVTATPADGFEFDRWLGSLTGRDAVLTFVLNEDTLATAVFVPEGEAGNGGTDTGPRLFVDIVGDGTVSPAGGTYEDGEEVMLVATPGVGSVFVGWEGAASGTELATTVTINGNTSVRAVFEADPEAGRDVGNGSSLPMCGSFGLATLPMVLLGWLTSTWARRRRRVL